MASCLEAHTPVGHRGPHPGLLRDAMTKIGPPANTGDGWQIGVGDMTGLALEPPPRGTLSAFFEWYRRQKQELWKDRKRARALVKLRARVDKAATRLEKAYVSGRRARIRKAGAAYDKLLEEYYKAAGRYYVPK